MPHHSDRSRRRRIGVWLMSAAGLTCGALGMLVALPDTALAQAQTAPLTGIITRLQQVIVGLAAGLATLFLSVGGVRYLFAGGDPSQIDKAKLTLRSAAIGYGIAALAGTLFALLRYIVGA